MHERTSERQGYRNGVRPRTLYTRVGPVTLQVPQTRAGSFSPEIFKRYQRSEQAFVLALMEMVAHGVSTRKVTEITESNLQQGLDLTGPGLGIVLGQEHHHPLQLGRGGKVIEKVRTPRPAPSPRRTR